MPSVYGVAAKAEILTYEEIIRLSRVSFLWGVNRLRITGGEPDAAT